MTARAVVREPRGAYATARREVPPARASLTDVPPPADPLEGAPAVHGYADAPFGLPVLEEIPELASVLQKLREVDRLIADVVDGLLLLEDTGLVASVTGVGIDTWLSVVARRTGSDARMLRTTAATMRRIPTLHAAFRAGRVSWAQVRSVVLAVRALPRHLDDRIDAAVAEGLDGLAGTEPDALTRAIRWHLAALDPPTPERDERHAVEQQYLAMQPRLDGSGGRFWGECGPEAWATLDAALNTTTTVSDPAADGVACAGAGTSDGLGDGLGDALGDALGDGSGTGGHPVRTAGRARLDRLITHLEHVMATAAGDPRSSATSASAPTAVGEPRGRATESARSRMQLLLRTSLSALLDRDQTPASLLTTLLGGHVRVTAATARRLVDERGADLRTVIIDDTGAVVGVGRRHRVAPGWLTDATLALHDTCTFPGCEVAARLCQTDHARPWNPARPGDPPGRTDLDELAPACGTHNRAKEPGGWVATQCRDGTRRWHHPRSGLVTETVPAPG